MFYILFEVMDHGKLQQSLLPSCGGIIKTQSSDLLR